MPQTLEEEGMGGGASQTESQGEVGEVYLLFVLAQLASPNEVRRPLLTPFWPPFPLLQCGGGASILCSMTLGGLGAYD